MMCVFIPVFPFFFLINQHYVCKEESGCHVFTWSASPIIVSHAFPQCMSQLRVYQEVNSSSLTTQTTGVILQGSTLQTV